MAERLNQGGSLHLGRALRHLADLYAEAGYPRNALAALREGIDQVRVPDAEEADVATRTELASALHQLSLLQREVGQEDLAASTANDSVALYRGLMESNDARLRPALVAALCNAAMVHAERGRLRDGERLAREAVGHADRLTETVPAAAAHHNLAMILQELNNHDRSDAQAAEALVHAERAVELLDGHGSPSGYRARALLTLSACLAGVRRGEEATEAARRAVNETTDGLWTQRDEDLPAVARRALGAH